LYDYGLKKLPWEQDLKPVEKQVREAYNAFIVNSCWTTQVSENIAEMLW